MDFTKDLGLRIRELRKKAGLSQDHAAEKAGISAKYLGQVERGEVNVSAVILHNLGEVLSVKIDAFFEVGHLTDSEELRSNIKTIVENVDDKQLQLIYKILCAITQ